MSNRSVLVRVPLGWTSGRDMCMEANPKEPRTERDYTGKQTVEMRSPDGSADIFQLLAGLCVACRHGFEMADAEEVAERTFADGDIHAPENAAKLQALRALPDSCAASADCLEQQRAVYEQHGVFSPKMIDGIIAELRAFITAHFYDCTPQMLSYLGALYGGGGKITERIDQAGGEGTAQFAARAIELAVQALQDAPGEVQ